MKGRTRGKKGRRRRVRKERGGWSKAASRSDAGGEYSLVRTDGWTCVREPISEALHPASTQRLLVWRSPPSRALVLKKPGEELMPDVRNVVHFLERFLSVEVVAERPVAQRLAEDGYGSVQELCRVDTDPEHPVVALTICVGGDGVILHASKLFSGKCPPVLAFSLGSLGFLASHPIENFEKILRSCTRARGGGSFVTMRMRLTCEVIRAGKSRPNESEIFSVLNEAVVSRGTSPYLSMIECYEQGRLITKVQADGVILSTPTGSTAYSAAAGGSMVHPSVPGILFTPICPHTLSFRPVVLPDSSELELRIPQDARSSAWAFFDGSQRRALEHGDKIRVRRSDHPMPTFSQVDQTGDWLSSLYRCLSWNDRIEQKAMQPSVSLDAVEEESEQETVGSNHTEPR
jgi:NAD+ kinase